MHYNRIDISERINMKKTILKKILLCSRKEEYYKYIYKYKYI